MRVLNDVTPDDTAAIADCTKAVVAIFVVLSEPGVTVGAVQVPAKVAPADTFKVVKRPVDGLMLPIGVPSIEPPVILGLEI